MGRTAVPSRVAAEVLFRSDRTCCVCRQRGKPVQIHHVDGDPSSQLESNLSVLCFDCHRDTQIMGGFDRKLDADQVILYRDDWYGRVEQRRGFNPETHKESSNSGQEQVSTPLVANPIVQLPDRSPLPQGDLDDVRPWDAELEALIRSLPRRRWELYRIAQVRWDTGTTSEMSQASYNLTDALMEILKTLTRWYPRGHFGESGPELYMKSLVQSRYEWHRALLTPNGQAGTGTGAMAATAVIDDLERAIAEMVSSLTSMREDFNYTSWHTEWSAAA